MANKALIKHAEALKKHCEENRRDTIITPCDCPFVVAFAHGYLCGLYGYPKDWLKEQNNDSRETD